MVGHSYRSQNGTRVVRLHTCPGPVLVPRPHKTETAGKEPFSAQPRTGSLVAKMGLGHHQVTMPAALCPRKNRFSFASRLATGVEGMGSP
jgi:hypothetical protein